MSLPEDRVRAYLDTIDPGFDLIAEGYGPAPAPLLTVTDLHDLLAELDAARAALIAASPDTKENQLMTESSVTIARPADYRPDTWLSPHELRIQSAPSHWPEHAGLLGFYIDNRYATVTPADLAEALTALEIPGFTASYTPPRPPLPTEPGLYVLANRPSVDRGDVFCLTSGGSWDFDDDVWLSAEGAHKGVAGPLVPLTKGGTQ